MLEDEEDDVESNNYDEIARAASRLPVKDKVALIGLLKAQCREEVGASRTLRGVKREYRQSKNEIRPSSEREGRNEGTWSQDDRRAERPRGRAQEGRQGPSRRGDRAQGAPAGRRGGPGEGPSRRGDRAQGAPAAAEAPKGRPGSRRGRPPGR